MSDLANNKFAESTEIQSQCPSVNPTKHIDPDNSGNHTISVPGGDNETPKANPWDKFELNIPGGLSEKPKSKPYDETSIPTPAKVMLDSDTYNDALKRLQQSFKESFGIVETLLNSQVMTESVEDKQKAFAESAMEDAINSAFVEAYTSGPIFEAVERKDKNDVKKLVDDLGDDIKKFFQDQKYKVSKLKVWGRSFLQAGIAAPLYAIVEAWQVRMWQIVGVTFVEQTNRNNIAKLATDKFKDQLGDYKILLVPAPLIWTDMFMTKFNWKNTLTPYFIIIDKKIPAEINSKTKESDEAYQELKKEGKPVLLKKSDKKPIKESAEVEEKEECGDASKKDDKKDKEECVNEEVNLEDVEYEYVFSDDDEFTEGFFQDMKSDFAVLNGSLKEGFQIVFAGDKAANAALKKINTLTKTKDQIEIADISKAIPVLIDPTKATSNSKNDGYGWRAADLRSELKKARISKDDPKYQKIFKIAAKAGVKATGGDKAAEKSTYENLPDYYLIKFPRAVKLS